MTLLLFSEYHHVIHVYNVMIKRYITLSVEKSNVMTTSVTTVQIFIEIDKIALKRSYDKQNLTLVIISY